MGTLINLILMNASFVRYMSYTEDLVYSNLKVDIDHITVDVLHDKQLLSFTTTCTHCQQTLTGHSTKLVHIIHRSKIIQALIVAMNCDLCIALYMDIHPLIP